MANKTKAGYCKSKEIRLHTSSYSLWQRIIMGGGDNGHRLIQNKYRIATVKLLYKQRNGNH